MLHSFRPRTLLLPLLLLAGSCASTDIKTDAATAAQATPEESSKTDPDEVADLEHKLAIANAKLEIARMELEAFEKQSAISLAHAKEDLAMTQATLDNFMKVELPSKRAKAELALQGAKDSVVEAAEELAQLEIMYKDQDLHDMTAEFVISRGERRAQRAEQRIQIQEREFTALVEHELPMEQRKHEIALAKAEEGLVKAETEAEIARRGKHIKRLEAEHALAKSERALSKAREGGE